MIYTEMTKKALSLSFEAHKDQKDKSGMPYIFHPFHLAEQMKDEAATIVALLHDVVEDSDYTFEDLKREGFGAQILEALELLTHDPKVPYKDYVAKIKGNELAKAVKLADLAHNSDLSRMAPEEINEKVLARRKKYQEATAFLMEG